NLDVRVDLAQGVGDGLLGDGDDVHGASLPRAPGAAQPANRCGRMPSTPESAVANRAPLVGSRSRMSSSRNWLADVTHSSRRLAPAKVTAVGWRAATSTRSMNSPAGE